MSSFKPKRFLVANFTAFYSRVAAIKKAVATGGYSAVLPDMGEGITPEDGQLSGADIAYKVHCHLRDFLQKQERSVRQTHTEVEIGAYLEAQYLMAVLADEIFILELEWPGRDHWDKNLLEKYFFRSCSSARTFFNRLNSLLNRQAKETLHEDLAIIYLMSMRLGFSGQYREQPGRKTLADYGQKLMQFIGYGGDEQTADSRIFQQAYGHCVNPLHKERLSSLIPWKRAGSAAIIGYLIATYLAWKITTLPLQKLLNNPLWW